MLKDECNPATIIQVNTSQLIHIGKVLLGSVVVTGDGAVGEIDVYDGTNERGKSILKMSCIANTSFNYTIPHDAYIEHGIYVKVNAATTYCTITYHTHVDKK